MFVDSPTKEFSLEIWVLHIENTCYEYLEADNSGGLVNNFRSSRQNEGAWVAYTRNL
ncbi:MAG: hypothetical protein VYA19_03720 [Pseudomonadota bacterium]|nr:hypothetical protein [Pseudomonadota bacterium]